MKIFLLLVMLTLTACTAKKLAVSNSDNYIQYQITKRIPLYSDQKEKLSFDIDKFLNNHKSTVSNLLPLLDNIQFNGAKVENLYIILVNDYKQIAKDFSALLSKYLAQLDKKQQKDLLHYLDLEDNKIHEKDIESKVNEICDRFSKFFGSITPVQRQIFLNHKAYYSERKEGLLTRRKVIHNRFKEIFGQDISPRAKEDLFNEAFARYQDHFLDSNKTLEITKSLTSTFTEPQKLTFKKKVEEIKEILGFYLKTDF